MDSTSPDRLFCEQCKRPLAHSDEEYDASRPQYCGTDIMSTRINEYDHDCLRDQLGAAKQEAANTKATLTELHGYVRDMCVYLGADEDEVPCDAWTLRDLLVVMKRVQQAPLAPMNDGRLIDDYSPECSVCGAGTDEGHTHRQCFEEGWNQGHIEGQLDAAQRMAQALAIEFQGETLDELLAKIPVSP